jgi:hypothetical protein
MNASHQFLTSDIYQLIDHCLGRNDIALSKHPRRNCLYQELEHCVKVQKENRETADRIKEKYLKNGFPSNFGLYLNGFIIRRNTDHIKQLNEMWWNEYSSGSERDQFSLMNCLWKMGIPVNSTATEAKEKRYYRIFRHF